MSNRTRARLINKLADVFEANLEEIYHLETANNGRSLNETRAQVSRLPDFFRYNAGLAIARRDSVIPVDGNYLNYTVRTPIGVVGTSTPFNHPLMIMVKSLAPTLASGCTTVVKPSEYTPLTTLKLAQLFVEACLPPGVFNVVTGLGPTTGKALAENPGLAKWVLTGGTEAGRITGAAAGQKFTHQTLELGGKTPVLVFDDFDVGQAVRHRGDTADGEPHVFNGAARAVEFHQHGEADERDDQRTPMADLLEAAAITVERVAGDGRE